MEDTRRGGLDGPMVLYLPIGVSCTETSQVVDRLLLSCCIVKNCRSPNDLVERFRRSGAGGRGGGSFLITAYLRQFLEKFLISISTID